MPEQQSKASLPMAVTEAGMVTDVRLASDLKSPSSIVVRALGSFNVVRPVQYWKAYLPMDVTLLGIFTAVMPLQPENA